MLSSLVLHALLLFALTFLTEEKRQIPAGLTARLAVTKPPAPVLSGPVPGIEPVAQRRPASRPAPIAKAVSPTALASPAAPAPISSAEPAKQAAVPAAVIPAASQAAIGADAGAVARFRLELMDLARRDKKYPRIAQDNSWEGRVELRLMIAEDGAISSLAVKKGAGRSVLDEEAQAMIRTAKSKATIPPDLRGKAFTLEIPVEFFLKDEER